jgi:hypothetical protein
MQEKIKLEKDCAERKGKYKAFDMQLQHLGGIRAAIEPFAKGFPSVLETIDRVFAGHLEPIPNEMNNLARQEHRLEMQIKAAIFVDLVLNRMASKEGRAFYAAVIRAILRNPESPREELRSFAHLIDDRLKKAKMKFAMVGDRQDNDIAAPTAVMGVNNILTIRLRSGTYARKQEGSDKATRFPPRFVAETLAQVKAILLCQDAWKSVQLKGDPPVFDWKVDFENREFGPSSDKFQIGLNYLLYGIRYATDRNSIIRKVCVGVLLEHLVESELDLDQVVAFSRKFSEDLDSEAQNTSVSIVLSALLDAGAGAAASLEKKIRDRVEDMRLT